MDCVHLTAGDRYLDLLDWLPGRISHYANRNAYQTSYRGIETLTFGLDAAGKFRHPKRVLMSETFRCRGHNGCELSGDMSRCRVMLKRIVFAGDPLTWRIFRTVQAAPGAGLLLCRRLLHAAQHLQHSQSRSSIVLKSLASTRSSPPDKLSHAR